jgi:hypothetical protein
MPDGGLLYNIDGNNVVSSMKLRFIGICMDDIAGFRFLNSHTSGNMVGFCVQVSDFWLGAVQYIPLDDQRKDSLLGQLRRIAAGIPERASDMSVAFKARRHDGGAARLAKVID